MSKVFSLSLATLMVFVSLFSSVQPNVAADVATPEPAPVEVSAVSMEVDQEEVVEEPTQVLPAPTEEPTEIIEEDAPPAPADEPAEDANAPPADEPLVEEPTEVATEVVAGDPTEIATEAATEEAPAATDVPTEATEITPDEKDAASEIESATEEPIKIVPNAVDPNPGDCPVEEICDGGGGGDGDATISVNVTIYNNFTHDPVAGVTLEFVNASGQTVTFKTTDLGGLAVVDLSPEHVYTVNIGAPGYTSTTQMISTGAADSSVQFGLSPLAGQVTVTVLDAETGAPIQDADVHITNAPDVIDTGQSSMTDSSGIAVLYEVNPTYYYLTVRAQGYNDSVATVSVTPGGQDSITVRMGDNSVPLNIQVIDSVTGHGVNDATVWISSDWVSDSGSTDASGRFHVAKLSPGEYRVMLDHDGYADFDEVIITHSGDAPIVLQMQPYQQGQLALTITDSETGAPIANAQVSIVIHDAPVWTYYATTGASGQMTSPMMRGGKHQLSVHADGYIYELETIVIVNGTTTLEVKLQPKDYGRFSFIVINAENGRPIANATITVSLRGGYYLIGSGMTEADGTWVGPTTGWAEYQYTIEKHGFKTVQNIVFVQGQPFSRTVYMEHGTTYDFDVSVNMPAPLASTTFIAQPMLGTTPGMMPAIYTQVNGTMVPVAGARVSLQDIYSNDELHAAETGVDGIASFSGVWEGRYRMVVSAPGMETYFQLITVGDGSTFDITINEAEPEPEEPTDPEPGDGDDDQTPTDPEPGDGDDDQTPTNPEPGDGDGQTPTNPEPGDSDDQTPTNPEPGDSDGQTPTNPQPGDSDDQAPTSPAPGTDGGVETPADPSPVDGGTDPATPGESETPATDSSVAPDAVAQAGDESSNASGTGTAGTESAARVQAESVTDLPSTGSGPAPSNGMFSTLFILAGVILLLAAVPSRRTR